MWAGSRQKKSECTSKVSPKAVWVHKQKKNLNLQFCCRLDRFCCKSLPRPRPYASLQLEQKPKQTVISFSKSQRCLADIWKTRRSHQDRSKVQLMQMVLTVERVASWPTLTPSLEKPVWTLKNWEICRLSFTPLCVYKSAYISRQRNVLSTSHSWNSGLN